MYGAAHNKMFGILNTATTELLDIMLYFTTTVGYSTKHITEQ